MLDVECWMFASLFFGSVARNALSALGDLAIAFEEWEAQCT
jgi:hypothetical protein